MAVPRLNTVTAFVDWNSQVHAANPPKGLSVVRFEHTMRYIGRLVGRVLNIIDSGDRYDVSLRFYYGWRKGFQPAPNRVAFTTALSMTDFSTLSSRPNVTIRPEIGYGDRLINGLEERLHYRLGIHLPDTYRFDQRINKFGEKMVDTALASDIVDVAHREPNNWMLVLAADDDIIPPVLVAESARDGKSGKIALIRARDGGPFFKIDGLRVWP